MITKIRNLFIVGVLLVAAGALVTVVDKSPIQLPGKERARPPAAQPTDKPGYRHVKLTLIIDGDAKNLSPDRVNVWYTVNGTKYPSHGAFQTKRYWFRVLEVKVGTVLTLTGENETKGQRIDVTMFYLNRSPAVIDNGSCAGFCLAKAQGTVK